MKHSHISLDAASQPALGRRSRALIMMALTLAALGAIGWAVFGAGGAERRGSSHNSVGSPLGMIVVPGGRAVIGTPSERLSELMSGQPRDTAAVFSLEWPQHFVQVPRFYLDQWEVSNEQYAVFLNATAVLSAPVPAGGPTLASMAARFVGTPEIFWKLDDVTWRQLYRANRGVLTQALPDLVVRDAQGQVSEARTEGAFGGQPLPAGVCLTFYDRRPPLTWPSMKPEPNEADLPVTGVSYNDAEAFAEWAGKHIPTEVEWEYAARGPAGSRYPWGEEWFDDASHVNWGGLVRDKAGKPVLMPVESLAAGTSWCGAYHLLGNAAEWTSSWFGAYAGNRRKLPWMGQYVKVIRGGSFLDRDALVLRCAARNWVGAGVRAPPIPDNRFEAVGFRCARYEEPGRSRLTPIMRRAAEDVLVSAANMDPSRYASAVREAPHPSAKDRGHHVTVREAAVAIVVIPLVDVPVRPPDAHADAQFRPPSLVEQMRIPLAIVHSDLPLAGGERGTWTLCLEAGHLVLRLPGTRRIAMMVPMDEKLPEFRTRRASDDVRASVDLDPINHRIVISCQTTFSVDGRPTDVVASIRALTVPLRSSLPAGGTWKVHRQGGERD